MFRKPLNFLAHTPARARDLCRWIGKKRKRAAVGLFLVMHILGALTSIQAVMSTRTSQGAIAWTISLNTFPYVAVPAYWVFGQSRFDGYDLIRQSHMLAESETRRQAMEILRREGMLVEPETDRDRRQVQLLQNLALQPLTRHNEAELLIDGEKTFDAIFDAIARAENYVLVQFYILRADGLGQKLKDALIAKATRGVRVYVLYDGMGSLGLPNAYLQELAAAGVETSAFETRSVGNRFRVNFRNHRKIVVVDGKEAFVGGHNVGDEYLGKDPVLSPWRDTHVRIRGPVVLEAQVTFVEDWRWATGRVPELNWIPEKAPGGDCVALCLPTGPADTLETATLFFLDAINSAEKRIWIVSPYFVPDEQLMSALQLAALRGVEVRVLIPENPDQVLVYLSSFSYLEEAEKAGVKVYRYQPGFLHQKVMLVDDYAATVGTVNFDNRSMRLNFEVTVMVMDKQFVRQVEAMLDEDFRQSRPVGADEYLKAGLPFRFSVRAARLLAPIQ
ncbi:MAG: cardiolipin synthase [Thermoguttaceae bacterium]